MGPADVGAERVEEDAVRLGMNCHSALFRASAENVQEQGGFAGARACPPQGS
jgi:hypothetical protein